MIINAKEKYFLNLGRKLSDPNQGIKAYWTTLNRLLSYACNVAHLTSTNSGILLIV